VQYAFIGGDVMGLKFLEKDEKILYISEALEVFKKIHNITDITELPCLYKRGKRPAVLVIDEQYAFTSPDSVAGTKSLSKEAQLLLNGMVDNTKILLDAARKKEIPIFYFYTSSREDGTDIGPTGEKTPMLLELTREGSKWVEIDERIKPQKGDYVIGKKAPSAFFGTPLNMILKYLKVDVNIVVGDATGGCVRATVFDSISNAYYPVIPEECVGDRSIGSHKMSLFDIMMKYGDVASLEDVLSWINVLY
jgi:maleamate amidohydrolase